MKKLLLVVLIALSTNLYSQTVTDCEGFLDFLKRKNTFKKVEKFPNSDALKTITFYEIKNKYFPVVVFKGSYKEYLYAPLNEEDLWNMILDLDLADQGFLPQTAGELFNATLRKHRLPCD